MRRTSPRLQALGLAFLLLSPGVGWSGEDKDKDKDSDQHLIAGIKAFEDSDYAKAVEELQKSVAAKPAAKAYLLLGNAYVKTGQLDDAKAAFERVLQLDPHSKKHATVERLIKSLGVLASTRLKISSSPPGATVYVDLKAEGAKGKTPVDVGVTPGPHRVILELEGYERLSVPNAVAVEGKDVPVSGTLKLKGCDLMFAIKPVEGVGIKLDGHEVPPTATRVAGGDHRIEMGGKGLIGVARTVTCAADKDNKFRPIVVEERLEVASTGTLALRPPLGVRIRIDGRETSMAEAASLKLPPGDHRVDIEAEGKAPWRVVTQVHAGEETQLRPELDVDGVKETGITLHDAPRQCLNAVDGVAVQNDALVPVKPGQHLVEVRCNGYYPYRRTVELKLGGSLQLDVRPEQRGRMPLYFGVAAAVLAAGMEAVAIAGHVKASTEVANSGGWHGWNNLEVSGHVIAAVLGAAAIAGVAFYAVGQRRPAEAKRTAATPARRVALGGGAVATPQGAAAVLQGRF